MMQSNKQYLDYHRQYMMELTTDKDILTEQDKVALLFVSSKIDEIEYNIRMKALEVLSSQLRETEAQKQRWINCGQVM